MKRGILLGLLGLSFLVSTNVSAGTQDFYFSDFTADYYVSQDNDGVSKMRVVEKIVAEFPSYNQNKGICRMIPYLNNGGKNNTLPNFSESDIKILRNGKVEPIYSLEKEDEYYEVCTGTDDYVTGTQVYTFEYTFEKVVTEYNKNGKSWQELYWDTNGNGWKQRFNKLIARVHFSDTGVLTGETSCYVGGYGENGSERCKVSSIEDGYKFETENLSAGENLTFDIEIKDGSFVIPEPEKSYIMFVALGFVLAISGIVIIRYLKTRNKLKEKKVFYDGYFIKPEYQPKKEYSLSEMAQIYIGKIKDKKVAILLKMVVDKKIEIIKGEKKTIGGYRWKIKVKSDNLNNEEENILKILNGGENFIVGAEIELKQRTATSELIALGEKVKKAGIDEAKRDGLIENNFKMSQGVSVLFWVIVVVAILLEITSVLLEDGIDNIVYTNEGKILVGALPITVVICLFVAMDVVLLSMISNWKAKFANRTKEGLIMSRYMDGLKMYIEMAEKDRIEFLQSVDGADTTSEGVVKLYEDLLPYAALFGLEKSWMEELSKYCQANEIESPTWCVMNMVAIDDFTKAVHTASSALTYSSSSSSSSGFSGGGGGGFSGGGGGGGGGGGR